MEITKKIIIFIFYAALVISCTNKKKTILNRNNFFIINQNNKDKPLAINNGNVKNIKMNLYSYKEKLYMGINYKVEKYDNKNDIILHEKIGILLLDSIIKLSTSKHSNKIEVNSIIDIDSYKKMYNNVYIDKNNFYVISYAPYLGQAYVLDIDTNKLRIVSFDYIADDKKVYCIHTKPILLKTKYPKTFKIIKSNGIIFGVDSLYIYSMGEKILPEVFLNEFESIPFYERSLIINKYFPNLSK